MSYSGTSGLLLITKDNRRVSSFKRPITTNDKGVIRKKRKKTHKWAKKFGHQEPLLAKSKCKLKKRIRTKPEAPFNSTQFIMDEHDNLNDNDFSTSRPRRNRDSSLSMESDDFEDDEPYSSAEDKEFMTKQFWTAYEDFYAERLDSMSKSQLVQEYFALEEKLTHLEKQLYAAREHDRRRIREPSPVDDEDEEEILPGEVPVDAETAAKIEVFRNEIEKLELENERLLQETFHIGLRRKHSGKRRSANTTSEQSSSDSETSSDMSEKDDGSHVQQTDILNIIIKEELKPGSDSIKRTKGGDDRGCCFGPDSGIASSEGGVSSSSEDLRCDENKVNSTICHEVKNSRLTM